MADSSNFSFNSLGSNVIQGRVWDPIREYSEGLRNIPESWGLDPFLAPLGTDPLGFTNTQIVIPKGRLVSFVRNAYTVAGRTLITRADGVNNVVAGYAPYNLVRNMATGPSTQLAVKRESLLGVPFITGVNDAYGTLYPGDYVTAYYGAAASTTATPEHVGKIVKWVSRKVYSQHVAAPATAVTLTRATLAPFTPRVVFATCTGTIVTGGTLAYSTGSSAWVASFGSAVTDVVYEYGQDVDQIAGQLVRIQKVDDLPGWLDKVQDDYGVWDIPPMYFRVPTTEVTSEVVTGSGGLYTLANKPLAPWKPITITITGTVIAPDGTSASVTGGELAGAPVGDGNYCHGTYYDINPVTGVISIGTNVTVTAMTVSYHYQHAYKDGRLWFPGVNGITDGSETSVIGTPAYLNHANLAGEMRVMIGPR